MYTRRGNFRVAGLSLVFIMASSAGAAQNNGTAAKDTPPAVFVDEGACPFECCTYREWTVEKTVAVFDRPNGNVIAHLAKGERVNALTGEIISKPIATKANNDIPDTPVKKGDTFYVLHYAGEGFWEAWFRGKKIQVDEGDVNGPKPKSVWWAKIKGSRGRLGWALAAGNFSNQDACG